MSAESSPIGDEPYPTILIFVSNTETIISLSKDTSFITNLTACSNSSKSPNITSVSNESTNVIEKLRIKRADEFYETL
jgi:hypothetical protein